MPTIPFRETFIWIIWVPIWICVDHYWFLPCSLSPSFIQKILLNKFASTKWLKKFKPNKKNINPKKTQKTHWNAICSAITQNKWMNREKNDNTLSPQNSKSGIGQRVWYLLLLNKLKSYAKSLTSFSQQLRKIKKPSFKKKMELALPQLKSQLRVRYQNVTIRQHGGKFVGSL